MRAHTLGSRVVVLMVGLSFAFVTPAAAREIAIENFDVDLTVAADGHLDVTEQIRLRFTGAWNGVARDIPVDYHTPEGLGYRLWLDHVAATDEAGQTLRMESRRVGHNAEYKIWIPGAEDAVRTVVLRYRAGNALRYFDSHDELYWNVTGDEWEMPIEHAAVLVHLPAGTHGVRAAAYTGAYGSRAREAEVTIEPERVFAHMTRPLSFREGLTIVVGWDKGVTRRPTMLGTLGWFLAGNWPLAFPLIVFFGMLGIWSRYGRDPRALPITVRYEPPGDLSPAEAGTLIDHRVDVRDVTATIVDLAVRGYVKIEEVQESQMLGLFHSTDYQFHLLKPEAEWSPLKPHEQQVLRGIFGGDSTVMLSKLKNHFYGQLPGIRDLVFAGLQGRGYYRGRSDTTRRVYFIIGLVLALTSMHAAAFGAAVTGLPFLTLALAIVLTGLAIMGIGWFMPRRTLSGARACEAALGFEEFLGRVERDRMERTIRTPEMFEKFLPYAMAFGVEEHWVFLFRDVCRTAPTWYVGQSSGSYDFGSFSRSLGQFSSQAGSTITSSPRSSGGSGFGGGGSSGGSSGGGFGGGGGHGF
jgi:Predicted membrane protein (DUF2207) C-terminal domain/Predicted membrane protein (DUF2207) N-terminal domain